MKISSFKNQFLYLFFTLILFLSCNKDPLHVGEIKTEASLKSRSSSSNSNSLIKLGRKRNNPYSFKNMKKALKLLNNKDHSSPTHLYVKFIPKSTEDIQVLEEWEMISNCALFNFPLEYQILESGENYIDEGSLNEYISNKYTSIPIGTPLPEGIKYKVIEKLLLLENDHPAVVLSFKLVDEKQASTLGDPNIQRILPPDDGDPGGGSGGGSTPQFNSCGCPIPASFYVPSGCIRVENDQSGFDAVQIARVKVKDNWFSSDVTFTDINGCWSVDKTYSNDMWMWVQFENSNVKIRTATGALNSQATVIVDDYVDRFTSPPFNNILVDYSVGNLNTEQLARRYWASAHTLNTVNNYRRLAGIDGITLPRTGLNVLLYPGAGNAGAPMLQGLSNSLNLTGWGFGLLSVALSSTLLPDITNAYNDLETANNFNATTYHELGHASHHRIVGENYWRKYRTHISANTIAGNGVYGSFGNFASGSAPQLVALGEAIGNYSGNRYGNDLEGGENREFEDDFIPRGLMFDLQDNQNDIVTDPNSGFTITENASGFTASQMFGSFNTNVQSISQFRESLRPSLGATPTSTANYNNIFNVYNVFD